MAENSIINVTINDNTTFGELRALLPERIRGSKPTYKALREDESISVIADKKTKGGQIFVYSNGYVYYRCEAGETILSIDECRTYSYAADDKDLYGDDFGKGDYLGRDTIGQMKWSVPIALCGELRASRNSMNRKGDKNRADEFVDIGEDEPVDIWETIGDERNPEMDAGLIEEEELEQRISSLTERQKEVARLIVEEKTQDEIAKELGINQAVVCRHIKKIKKILK